MESKEALDIYLDFLEDSISEDTPHIDAVLQQHKRRSTEGSREQDASGTHESRLLKLEKQLTDLLLKSSKKSSSSLSTDVGTTASVTTKDSDQTTPTSRPISRAGRVRSSREGAVSRHRANISSVQDDKRKKKQLLRQSSTEREKKEQGSVRVLNLELDSERERRWKAEEAASRLVVHVQTLQGRLTEADKRQETAALRALQAQGQLEEEKHIVLRLQEEKEELQRAVVKGQGDHKDLECLYKKQGAVLRDLEASYKHLEQKKMEELAGLRTAVTQSESLSAGHQRELELLRKSLSQSEGQVKHLQELLIARDEERQRDKERRRPLSTTDVQDMVAAQVQQEQNKMAAVREQLEARLSEKQLAYNKLEDEFRMALRMEASRYDELEKAHREVCEEIDATRQTAVAAVQKEQKAVGVVSELTTLVKELQLKVRDVSGSNHKMEAELGSGKKALEERTAERNKLEVKLQATQEELIKLEGRVQAQTSVIEGLRDERKLWGQELAHQGASLAQERGRMESQLDALTSENRSLREELTNERDTVRIRDKQLEDHAHSVQQLRRSLVERDREREEDQKELVELRKRMEQEQEAVVEMQEQLLSLAERKEELKDELAAVQEDKKHWKEKFRDLQEQWEEKVASIGGLEQSLHKLQENFTAKEEMLTSERDKALAHAKVTDDRVRACDDAFREQLEAKEAAHQSHFRQLAAQTQREVELANKKVAEVEEEMRVLLVEVNEERTRMEAKVAKFTAMVQNFQQDIGHQTNS